MGSLGIYHPPALRPAPDRSLAAGDSDIVPVGQILRIPGLLAVVLAGVVLVSASDLIVIYVPLPGAERNIDVQPVGPLLTLRAGFSVGAGASLSGLLSTL